MAETSGNAEPQLGSPGKAEPQLGPGNAEPQLGPGNAEPQLGPPGKAEPQLGRPRNVDPKLGPPESAAPQLGPPGKAEPQLGPDVECRAGARRSQEHREWYSRGYLPHCDHPGLLQSITYRLADSLPADVLARLEEELRLLPPEKRDPERRRRVERWLDAGYGCCVLRDPRAAGCVVDTWRHFAGDRYDLIAWVVMPNHVHVLVRVYEGVALGKMTQSWKSYTGRRIAPLMLEKKRQEEERREEKCRAGARRSQVGRAGARRSQVGRAGARRSQVVWMREYWDRFIRDETHFGAVVDYIHRNPVMAGLVSRPRDWPWSNAREYPDLPR